MAYSKTEFCTSTPLPHGKVSKIDTFSQNYFEMVTEQNIPQVFSSVLEKYEQRISKVRYRQN